MGNEYERIAEQARKHERVQTLMHYLNKENLKEVHQKQKKAKPRESTE